MKNCFSTLYTGVTVAQNMICIALWTRLDRGLLCKKQRDKFKVENISLLYFPVNGGRGRGEECRCSILLADRLKPVR